jgi:PPOX class probable F420-dependent enzyme
MPDGTPQATPVWFDVDGEMIRVNAARGRVKDRNMTARPKVALAILDPDDPYRWLQIRGTVISSTTEGGREHFNRLNYKYHGTPVYAGPLDQVRVIFHIRPEKVAVGS